MRNIWLIATALFVFSLALYAPSLRFGFIGFDDDAVLLTHPHLYNEHSFLRSLSQIFLEYFPREEPLLVRDVTWAVDSRLFGFNNPFGYHLGNVVLNAANAVLLFLFLLGATRQLRLAAISAALWSALAIHVEPVCWVMGRKDTLSTFFVLAALFVEARAALATDERRRRVLRALALLLFPIAVLAKFSAITLVAVVAAYRLLAPHLVGRVPREPPPRFSTLRTIGQLWPHILIAAMLHVWYSGILRDFGVTVGRGPSPLAREHLEMVARFAPLVFGIYFKHLVVTSQHSIFYDWPNAHIALSWGEQALSAAIALGLVAAGIFLGLRRKDLFFFFVAFFLLMAPYLNIVYIGIWVADRYLYLSSFCLVVIAVWIVEDLIARMQAGWRRWAGAFAVGAASLFLTYQVAASLPHQRAFGNDHSFWQWEATRANPSMLALAERARTLIVAAEEAKDPMERQRLGREAQQAIDHAQAHHARVPWRPLAHYTTSAHSSLLDLFIYRGRLAAVLGKPLEAQLRYYGRGFAVSGRATEALLASRILLEMAERDSDDVLARQSLRYYAAYMKRVQHDSSRLPEMVSTLNRYGFRFASLRPELEAIARRYHLR